LIERLGAFPATRASLNAEILETTDLGTYTREKIVFDTRENLSTIGYLLLPKSAPRPLPAVVCFSGHGRGLPDILGIADDGSQRTERNVGYSKEYAVQCVEHGYATFAVEQLAFGTRRDDAARRAGPGVESCRPAACAALLLGQTMAGWRVWDAMRAIDYLGTRSEVDSARIATLGASGGGTTSLLTGAVDQRVKVAVVSAYFNTFRDSIVSISHCPDNYVPGLLQDMEMYDLSGLVAPRALFVESGRNDRIFPIAGSQAAAEKARAIYRSFGVPDRFGYEIHEGGHEVHLVGAFDFLKRAL
jgi:dienelactone hydrolase